MIHSNIRRGRFHILSFSLKKVRDERLLKKYIIYIMDKTNSANNFHRRQILEKLDKLEEIRKDMITIKEMLIEMNSNIIKIDKKTPKRTAGWIMGEYKTYED